MHLKQVEKDKKEQKKEQKMEKFFLTMQEKTV
jgi:hypothetical protein